MLEIRDIQFFPDGRSIVDTMGGRRFKVVERNILDGYNTAKVEFLEDDKVANNEELEELKTLHDETLQHTKDWMEGMSQGQRKSIVDHYGVLPETEQDYWTLNDGPTWVWWVINILPIDLKIKVLKSKSRFEYLYFLQVFFNYFSGFIVIHDIFEEKIGEYATHFEVSCGKNKAKKLNWCRAYNKMFCISYL